MSINRRILSSFGVLISVLMISAVAVAQIVSGISSVGSSANITITQLAINKPDSVMPGDVMIAGVAVNGGAPATVTPPSGWNLILRTDNETNVSVLSYWKVVGTTEPSSYTWTINSQTRAVGGITPYSGVDTTNPVDVASGASDRSTIAIAPAITTSVDDTEIITLFAYNAGVTNGNHFEIPVGMNEKYDTTNTPFGPSLASHDMEQAVAGGSGTKSSDLGNGPQRNWVAQQIALRPVGNNTADNFNSYADGDLSGLNGGTGWTGAWSGDSRFDIQGDVTYEGAKAVMVNVPGGQEPIISRTFSPKTSGVLRWAQRKDAPDHGSGVRLWSGNTLATYVGIGSVTQPQSGGPEWNMSDGTSGAFIIQPYIVGVFDAVAMEFDAATDMYRVSINNGPYTEWKSFLNPVTSVDTLSIDIVASGNDVANNYWDDIRFDD